MLTGIDHLVVAVPDLDAARQSYTDLGFTVVPGGRHPIGTHNALIAFADGSYVELIAFYEPNADHRWWQPLQRGGGLVDFCMQTDDLRGDMQRFREAGVALDDPRPLTRKRPDGFELRWVLSIPRGADRGVAPFLIHDETPRDERVPRQRVHPNGATGVGTVTVAVQDEAAVARWYTAVLGSPGRPVERAELIADGIAFVIGPHTLEFVAPRGAGPLAAWIADRGASPWAATLRGGKRGPLDSQKSLGARFAFA
jgi:catechol 2,3-dioxygenase-like lactoylglutathione lyase family enzyme